MNSKLKKRSVKIFIHSEKSGKAIKHLKPCKPRLLTETFHYETQTKIHEILHEKS